MDTLQCIVASSRGTHWYRVKVYNYRMQGGMARTRQRALFPVLSIKLVRLERGDAGQGRAQEDLHPLRSPHAHTQVMLEVGCPGGHPARHTCKVG